MSAPSPIDTLFLPFKNGFMDWDDNTLFMGADTHSSIAECDAWQIWKPAYDRLAKCMDVRLLESFPKNGRYSRILILLPKQVQEAQFWIAQGLSVLKQGGVMIAAAANDAGGNRLPKWLQEAGFSEIRSDAKNKSRVVWSSRPVEVSGIVSAWAEGGTARGHDFGNGLSLFTQPGLFSWDRLDRASQLLTEHLPPALGGHGADIGCGYGFLSHTVLRDYPKVKSLLLAEADSRALACATANIAGVQGDRTIIPLWHDATKSFTPAQPLDFVVMNPPFHTGKKTDVDLGQSFIRTAFAALKKGGNLSLVANNHLPYEALCESLFKNVKIVVQKDGFKVIRAVK